MVVFFWFNYVKNKNKKKKEKKKLKTETKKPPPLSGSGQCVRNFSRSEGKKWLLGICLIFETNWT